MKLSFLILTIGYIALLVGICLANINLFALGEIIVIVISIFIFLRKKHNNSINNL